VRFEPTPASRTGSPPQWAQLSAAGGGPSVGSTTPGVAPGASATDGPDSRIRSLQDAERRTSTGQVTGPLAPLPATGPGWTRWLQLAAVVLLLVAALVLTPATALLGRRRRRRAARDGAARVEAAWADLYEQVGDLGIDLPSSLTPRQVDHRLQGSVLLAEQPRAALARVTTAVEQARYARPGAEGGDVSEDVRAVVRAVAGSRTRSERLRAWVYPRSGAERTASAARWVARLFSSADSRLAGWSHRLRLPRLRRPNRRA
jgi:hypothetical protein